MNNVTRRHFIIGSGAALATGFVHDVIASAEKLSHAVGHPDRKEINTMRKTVLITGAGTGFGRDVSLKLAEKGHRVIATVELPSQVTQLRNEAATRNLSLQVEKIDILNERDRHFASSLDVDVLLNNAGIAEAGAVAEMPLDVFRSQFETNVFSSLDLTQRFIKNFVSNKRKGKIIFVSSVAGLIGGDFTGAYCASKHAIEAIAEALHTELKPFGIKVATVNPGPYLTGFNDRMMESFKNWYDPHKNFIDHSKLKFPFEQFDPAEMVDKIVEVVEQDSGKFRNLLPQSFIDIVKKSQQDAWLKEQ